MKNVNTYTRVGTRNFINKMWEGRGLAVQRCVRNRKSVSKDKINVFDASSGRSGF